MEVTHMERLVGQYATQLFVVEATRANRNLAKERVGGRVVVEQDERRATRDVKAVAGTIDRMFPSKPEYDHRLCRQLEQ